MVKIRAFEWHGEIAVNIVYELSDGGVRDGIFFEDQIAEMELVEEGQFWTFDADGDHLKLAIEAQRIRLAHHFDPYLAIHTSIIRPLPHQITAVYEEMLSRQPLRFLLADDPGAGKTIMAGLCRLGHRRRWRVIRPRRVLSDVLRISISFITPLSPKDASKTTCVKNGLLLKSPPCNWTVAHF